MLLYPFPEVPLWTFFYWSQLCQVLLASAANDKQNSQDGLSVRPIITRPWVWSCSSLPEAGGAPFLALALDSGRERVLSL